MPDLHVNEDGSVDVLFGPESPGAEWETTWIKTIPGKGWFVYFWLYHLTDSCTRFIVRFSSPRARAELAAVLVGPGIRRLVAASLRDLAQRF
jgi:hypothetical protein